MSKNKSLKPKILAYASSFFFSLWLYEFKKLWMTDWITVHHFAYYFVWLLMPFLAPWLHWTYTIFIESLYGTIEWNFPANNGKDYSKTNNFHSALSNLLITAEERLNINSADRRRNLRNGNTGFFNFIPTNIQETYTSSHLYRTCKCKRNKPSHPTERDGVETEDGRMCLCACACFSPDRAPMWAHWEDLISQKEIPPHQSHTHTHNSHKLKISSWITHFVGVTVGRSIQI